MGVVLWMAGEVQSDVADDYRRARKEVEAAINEVWSTIDASSDLRKIALIAIIRKVDRDSFDEVRRYRSSESVFEARLRIPHNAFAVGSHDERCVALVDAVGRCLEAVRSTDIRCDVDRLDSALHVAASSKGWRRPA